MSDLTLNAEPRTQFGKGAARKIRRAHQIPAVMYGHGTDPVHITLPGHETMLALKTSNALLTIVLDGKEQLALAKDVQRDPIKPVIEHVDLVVVRAGERVKVDVPVHVIGEAAPDTLVALDLQTIEVEVAATAIPEMIEVSVEGAQAGTQVLAGGVTLPEGATLVTDPEALVVNVTTAISSEALEAELARMGVPGPAVEVRLVDRLERQATGKVRLGIGHRGAQAGHGVQWVGGRIELHRNHRKGIERGAVDALDALQGGDFILDDVGDLLLDGLRVGTRPAHGDGGLRDVEVRQGFLDQLQVGHGAAQHQGGQQQHAEDRLEEEEACQPAGVAHLIAFARSRLAHGFSPRGVFQPLAIVVDAAAHGRFSPVARTRTRCPS